MTFHILRRKIISLSALKYEPSNLTTFSRLPLLQSLYLFSTKTAKPSGLEITEYLITRHELSPESALNAATVLSKLKDYKTSDLILDYIKKSGVSKAQLEGLIIKDPNFLAVSFHKNIKPKIQTVRKLGFTNIHMAALLCSVPTFLTIARRASSLGSSIIVLQSVLGCNYEVIKLLRVCDWFLASDLEKTLKPNIELLESCRVAPSQIRQLLYSFPRFFLSKHEFMKECVKRVDAMGLTRDSNMYIHGIRAVSSMSPQKWESKLQLLRNLGFTESDILFVFRRTPQVFAISEKKIKEVTNILLTKGNVDITFLVQHAELLIYSATRRIKPRLEIMYILQSKSLLKKKPSLLSVCKMDDEVFLQKYLYPYTSELGEVAREYLALRGLTASA